DFAGGYLFSDDAALDPPRLVSAASQAAALAGAEIRTGVAVRRVAVSNGRAVGVETDQGVVEGDAVIVCAGAWSGLVEGAMANPAAVRPARGQVVELAARPVPVASVVYGPGGYMVPRADGHVYVGSTLEFVGYRRGVTVAGMAKLLALATTLVPSLREATVTRSWSSFRPYTDDGAPLVGAHEVDGLFLATGHYRSGILMAPVTAEIVRDLVLKGERHPRLDAMSPSRPAVRA
ncbi:MAG: FAD-dependent oxidoreductase, partial [Polyangiales bacterium]